MTLLKSVSLFFILAALVSCTDSTTETPIQIEANPLLELTKSQKIINESIVAHGGELYNSANYSFVFRENTYTFKNNGSDYEYSRTTKKRHSTVVDLVVNGTLNRTINGSSTELTKKQESSISESINSVIYFATLPHKLSDKAVNSKFIETTQIRGSNYQTIKVAFSQEGGGEDFEDEYYYWINSETKKIDYFAYNYQVNGGGVRFRSAYNTRVVDGITFQDYVNYKAEVGTPLKDLPALYEANKLTEISLIDTEEVLSLITQ